MKSTITPAERLQLHGVALLGRRYLDQLDELEAAVRQVLDIARDEPAAGHIADMVGNARGPDEMLEILGIRVEEAPTS